MSDTTTTSEESNDDVDESKDSDDDDDSESILDFDQSHDIFLLKMDLEMIQHIDKPTGNLTTKTENAHKDVERMTKNCWHIIEKMLEVS